MDLEPYDSALVNHSITINIDFNNASSKRKEMVADKS